VPGALTEGSISEEMEYVKDFKINAADVRRSYDSMILSYLNCLLSPSLVFCLVIFVVLPLCFCSLALFPILLLSIHFGLIIIYPYF
jgi:hypothetical protein